VPNLVDESARLDSNDDASRSTHGRASYDVLVVDDEAVVRDFLQRCLESAGYRVKQATNADEALEFMTESPTPAVLCDIRMPGHDGLWLAQRIRAKWPRAAIIMATAVDDHDTVRQSSALGAVDYLTKPIAAEHLLQVVGRALRARTTERKRSATSHSVAPASGGSLFAPAPIDVEESEDSLEGGIEAEYTLEHAVRCASCREKITTLKAVRVMRSRVNFTSTLPRRGRLVCCPKCLAIMPVELGNF
jgi:CheY-like chemotaxis protein